MATLDENIVSAILADLTLRDNITIAERCFVGAGAVVISEAAQVAHIGVDAKSGLVHTVGGTAALANDVTQAQALLSGEETEVYADTGFRGVEKREENQGVPVTWHGAMKRGRRSIKRHLFSVSSESRVTSLRCSSSSRIA